MNGKPNLDARPVLAVLCDCPDRESGGFSLASFLGEERTEQFRLLCLDLLQRELPLLRDLFDLAICPSNEGDREMTELGFPYADYVIPQPAGSRGVRFRAILDALRERGRRRTVLLAADCPSLPLHYLRVIRRLFREKQAVIGPAQEGDVYVLGLEGEPPEIESAPWGTDGAYGGLAEILRRKEGNVGIAPPWYRVVDDHAFYRAAVDLRDSPSLDRQQLGLWIESVLARGVEAAGKSSGGFSPA